MKLIVGLGNPGKDYLNTRHNVGFIILDQFVQNDNWQKKFDGLVQIVSVNNEKVILLKPTTFMNLSGNSVYKVMNYYNVSLEDVLVIQDDMDMEFGKIKIKKDSSAGGHNGIKSIISCFGSNSFCRLKVGIGRDNDFETVDFVLGKFSKNQLDYFSANASLFNDIITSFIMSGADRTMNKYNSLR